MDPRPNYLLERHVYDLLHRFRYGTTGLPLQTLQTLQEHGLVEPLDDGEMWRETDLGLRHLGLKPWPPEATAGGAVAGSPSCPPPRHSANAELGHGPILPVFPPVGEPQNAR